MRTLIAALLMAIKALAAAPIQAADFPQYPPVIDIPDLPPVDYGLGDSFYLRGSAAVNMLWAYDASYECVCINEITDDGYGYSFGAGFGYETGTGLRADFTVDYLSNVGLTADDTYELTLRSTLGMANVYYDFSFGGGMGGGKHYGKSKDGKNPGYHHGGGGMEGGLGGYVGLGIGAAFNRVEVEDVDGCECESGESVEAVGAVMAGLTYDMGTIVGDLGYRGLYMNKVTNATDVPYYVNDVWAHEFRGTVRHRFN